ncbi:MAG: MogA/MoaB family molybdenum cofactor biosynthesis protein [Candidatus Methanomethylicia archaeon]
MSVEHKREAEAEMRELKVAIIVVSTSRYRKILSGEAVEDASGEEAQRIARNYGYKVTCKEIIPDDKVMIQKKIFEKSLENDAIIFIGGTGITKTDLTYEAVQEILDKRIDGFGEIFRILSYRDIGSAAIISRAIAGIYNGILIAAIPGSPKAISLALEKILLPELPHIILHARRE